MKWFVVLLIIVHYGESTLYGGYQRWTLDEPFTISQIDPKTAQTVGNPIWTNPDIQILFGGCSAVDHTNSIYYFPAVNAQSPNLSSIVYAIDMSDLGNIVIIFDVTLEIYVTVMEYDSVNDRVIVGGPLVSSVMIDSVDSVSDIYKKIRFGDSVPTVQIGYIDVKTTQYTYLTSLPAGNGFSTVSGSATAFDPTTQLLVAGTYFVNNTTQTTQIDVLNLQNNQITTYPLSSTGQTQCEGVVLINGKFYVVLDENNSMQLTYSLFDPTNGNMQPLGQWTSQLVFIINGIIIYSVEDQSGYTIIGTGTGPPVTLLSFNPQGNVTNVAVFPGVGQQYNQAQFLFSL